MVHAVFDYVTQKYTLMRGKWLPSVRCAANAGGECIARLLGQWRPPQVFDLVIHIAESDEFSGNLRGERLLAQDVSASMSLHVSCVGHKFHSACSKTLALNGLKGLARTLLSLHSLACSPSFESPSGEASWRGRGCCQSLRTSQLKVQRSGPPLRSTSHLDEERLSTSTS